jgi:perosamine synthetase
LINQIINSLVSVAGEKAALHEPEITGNAQSYVKDCLDTGWVSTAGAYVGKFEQMLSDYTGAPYVIATMNGTSALHTALLLAGVKPGDEVIIPALTFVATANAVAYCGAEPHFADCEERTLGLDPAKLAKHLKDISRQEKGQCVNKQSDKRITAIVCMHTFGHPVDLEELLAVCNEFGITLIEDAAESLGSFYKGKHTGNTGLISILSFNGNKIVTSGAGGAILTHDKALGEKARHLTTTAKKNHTWEYDHDQIGYNYRISNISAALGCSQLENLENFLIKKRTLAERYEEAFMNIKGAKIFTEPANCNSNYWLNVLILDEDDIEQRNAILNQTNDNGLQTRPAWVPMHELIMFKSAPKMDLNITESLHRRVITLPSSPKLAAI